MTKDEIIRSPIGREQLVALAQEAGMDIDDEASGFGAIITAEPLDLERFAALVAEPWIETNKALAKEIIELKKQAEQEPVVKYYGEKLVKGSKVFALLDRDLAPDTLLYAAPIRTKDLTDDEIESIMVEQGDLRTIAFARAVIAADREKNK